MHDFIDKTDQHSGTPLNREAMMAVQGFSDAKIVIEESENKILIYGKSRTLEISFNDNIITQTFTGNKTITKETTIQHNGSIWEELS